MRRKSTSLVALVLAVVAIAVGGTGQASADSYCPDGWVCFWSNTQYEGTKWGYGASWADGSWHWFSNGKWSMKNRFTNRAVYYYNGLSELKCRNPNDEDVNVQGGAQGFYITVPDKRCWQ
ncbi:MAG TPA: peptidase inhibitor family I36 protein [Thermoleophilaceae bacterium]|jgi:hypothetical protein